MDTKNKFKLGEDWLAVVIAFVILLLSVVGVLGENAINIKF